MIYCTLLNPALDVVYQLRELEHGTTITDVLVKIIPAGKGLNVAKAVRILGEEVGIVGIVPEYNLHQFEAFFKNLDIRHFLYPVEGTMRINTTISSWTPEK